MKKLLCAAVLLLAVGCVWEPFAMYDYKAIVEVTPPAAQTISSVVVMRDTTNPPDTSHYYLDTTYTLNVTVYLKEMTGKKFRFEGAECHLYDSKGGDLGFVGGASIIPPKTNEDVDSVDVALKLTFDDADLYGLDLANEAEKWNAGTGFLGFTGEGNEIDHALSVECLEGFAPITVTRGSLRIEVP